MSHYNFVLNCAHLMLEVAALIMVIQAYTGLSVDPLATA